MSVQTLTRVDSDVDVEKRDEIDPSTGEPRCAHIIAPTADKTAVTLMMEARINGTQLTAICGHKFVPERDPKAYPLCSKCRQIREEVRPDENPEEING